MALLKLENILLSGIAAAVPKNEVDNLNYGHISVAERELFIKTTGIAKRRVAPDSLATSDFCFESAKQLMKKMNWEASEIDVVIMVTQSPDYFIPGSAVILQDRLGLKKSCLAFDINLGCSGYVYGLYVLGSLLSNGQIKKALLLAGDKSTASTAYTDKSAYPIFGDAGSATALQYDITAQPIYFNLCSDGSGKDAIIIEHGGSRNGIKADTFELQEIGTGIARAKRHLKLDGIEIFNFALREVSANINELYNFAEKRIEETNFFVFHQANKLVNESVRKKLKVFDKEKVPYSLDKFGNTSSASIPLTIVSELKEKLENKKNTVCFSGFGVGFSWGSCLLATDKLICLPLIELS